MSGSCTNSQSYVLGAYFHSILEFGHDGAFGDESEKLALGTVGQWHDEQAEDAHLRHQKDEHLSRKNCQFGTSGKMRSEEEEQPVHRLEKA